MKWTDAFCVRKESNMLWTICVILLVLWLLGLVSGYTMGGVEHALDHIVILLILWLLGLVSGYTMGGVIHILLVIAIVVVLIRVIQGRKIL